MGTFHRYVSLPEGIQYPNIGLSKTGGDPQKVFFLFFLTEQLWIVWLHDDEPSSFVSYTSMYPVSDTPNLPFLMFLTFLIVFAVPLHLLLPDSLCLIYFADLCSIINLNLMQEDEATFKKLGLCDSWQMPSAIHEMYTVYTCLYV